MIGVCEDLDKWWLTIEMANLVFEVKKSGCPSHNDVQVYRFTVSVVLVWPDAADRIKLRPDADRNYKYVTRWTLSFFSENING